MLKIFTFLFLVAIYSVAYSESFSTQEEKAQQLSNSVIKKYCKGRPKMVLELYEFFGKNLKVNPDFINIKRVSISEENEPIWWGSRVDGKQLIYLSCNAVFYSPVGSETCRVNFDSFGTITEACGVGDKNSSSKILIDNYREIFWKNVIPRDSTPKKNEVEIDPGTGRWINRPN